MDTQTRKIYSRDMPIECANLLIAEAEMFTNYGKDKEKYPDNKHYLHGLENLVDLIAAGAEIHCLNGESGQNYIHEVSYQGQRFVAVSEFPIEPIISNH